MGVTGGIAVYKACEVVRFLKKDGHEVRVIMTENAKRFVAPLTFEVLSCNPVSDGMFSSSYSSGVEHCDAAAWCDLFVVAPATANFIGKLASGIADDLLTTTAMALPKGTPLLLAPAMNVRMWENPVLQRNLRILSEEGESRCLVIPPVEKKLACGETGVGGLAEPEEIFHSVIKALDQ